MIDTIDRIHPDDIVQATTSGGQAIPLLDDERAAVEDTVGAIDALLERIADVPTPDDQHHPACGAFCRLLNDNKNANRF